MRSRYYNPEIKRFINQDILTGNIGNNKSLNRYSYVEGNPVSYTDPFGLSPYKAMAHAALDVIGIFCPIADVVNAIWYFADGEGMEGIKCLVYAIPGTDIYGGLTKFTTKGSKGYKIAATAEDIITHGGHAGTIVFAANDTGQLSADLIDKYFVEGAEVTSETAIEIITLALTGTQLGLSTKNGISFNGKMYADDVMDMSGVKVSDNTSVVIGADVGNEEKTIADIARKWQLDNGGYGNADDWIEVKLNKGDIVWGGSPGQSNFYTSNKVAEMVGFDATKLYQGLQVGKGNYPTYRPGFTMYEVQENIVVAYSKALANKQISKGGFEQFFILDYDKVLKPILSRIMTNL